jgi:hypothetical protein
MPREVDVLRRKIADLRAVWKDAEKELDEIKEVRDALEFRCVLLTEALRRARDDMEGWGGYASPYFQEKWGLSDDLKAIIDVLAGV